MSKMTYHHSSFLGFLFDLVGTILVWLIKMLTRLLWRLIVIVVCHPRTTAAVTLGATLILHFGAALIATIAGVLLAAAATWKAAHGDSFEATVGTWVRTWWRRWYAYRRQWVKVCTRCELAVTDGDKVHLPRVSKVVTTRHWDRLTVRPQIGQELATFRDAGEKLRIAFGAQRAAVREISPTLFGLDFMRSDPFQVGTVPATPIPASVEEVDFRRIPIGVDEFGDPFCVSLLGGTMCGSGSIGAGKAGIEWNILRGIAPAIAAGLVRPIFIDPKIMELAQGHALVADDDYATGPEDTVALLEGVLADMKRDGARKGEQGERDFEPGPGRPLTVIFVDEGAPLVRYWPRSIRSKIDDLLGTILTQGRAVGYTVVFLIQEPTKDTFTLRDLFTRRLALRLPTESHTDAALIEDAVEYGAQAHRISESTPGVLFSLQDGARSITRARLGYVENHHIRELVEYVREARKVVSLDARRSADTEKAAA
jgi:S-DNA-T family DNA segregation ATPase FtsK/SpoIIIE